MKRLLFLPLIATLSGCSLLKEEAPGISLESLSLVAEKDMNQNSATTVDLVVAYNKDLLENLKKLSSSSYFTNVNQLRRDNPQLMDVWRWELVPSQIIENFQIRMSRNDAWGVVVFADYQTPGEHRIVISNLDSAYLVLGREDLQNVKSQDFLSTLPNNNPRPPLPEAENLSKKSAKPSSLQPVLDSLKKESND